MKKNRKKFLTIGIILFLFTTSLPFAQGQENQVRAKIGILIKSGEKISRAKSRDRIAAGDLLRIYIHPENNSYVYVVHTDRKTVTALHMVDQNIKSATLVLPSLQTFYQVDGRSQAEAFTIVCSPRELKEVSALAHTQYSYEQWAQIENALIEKNKIDLSQQPEKPFTIAGNVRGGFGAGNGDPFVNKLQIFSGNELLVKKYEFKVKK